MLATSIQGGGVSRYTLPPCTNKRRTTNLKTKNNQTCQKIKLYGSPTTKELKRKHSSRLVGGAETGGWGGEDSHQGSRRSWWARWWLAKLAVPHCEQINQEKQPGSETNHSTQGSSAGK